MLSSLATCTMHPTTGVRPICHVYRTPSLLDVKFGLCVHPPFSGSPWSPRKSMPVLLYRAPVGGDGEGEVSAAAGRRRPGMAGHLPDTPGPEAQGGARSFGGWNFGGKNTTRVGQVRARTAAVCLDTCPVFANPCTRLDTAMRDGPFWHSGIVSIL